MTRRYKGDLLYPRAHLRLVLADDQTILRDGLRAMLDAESDLEVVGAANNTKAAVALCRRLLPDIVITELSFPNGIGVQAVAQLRGACPGVRVLLLTTHRCQECARAALSAGARAYVLKDSPFDVLLRAIRSEGFEYDQAPLASAAMTKQRGSSGRAVQAQIAEMTARERQVLIGVAQGYSSKRIAGNLGLSVRTIEKHRFKMMHRLGLLNVAAVTRYAMDSGLLHAQDEPWRNEHSVPPTS